MGASTVSVPSVLNGFNVNARNSTMWEQMLNPGLVETDKVLVLVQLNGGNDGLNTVIPLEFHANYQAARPNIYIPENMVLPLDGVTGTGLHPFMAAFQDLYAEGKLAIVQGAGYPSQSFSHFRGTDIWRTAADHDQVLNTGWIGRYLSYEFPNYPFDFPNPDMPHPLAIEIGRANTLTNQGPLFGMGIAIADPEEFYELVEGLDTPLPNTPAGDQVRYVRLIARQANHYADYIKEAYDNVTYQEEYPDTGLAAQLKIVARLIAGGLQTRVYHVNMGGFDTHDNQVQIDAHWIGHHAELLKELSEAIHAFQADLAYHGVEERVLGMTYSEFGRRMISNGSFGTDHGSAAPMFVFGKNVQAGVIGENTFIPAGANAQSNVPMQVDFRSVYTTIMQDWFCVPQNDLVEIMLQEFPTLPLIENSDCVTTTSSRERNQNAGKSLLSNYPNPFTNSTNVSFECAGGRVRLQILDTAGKIVATPLSGVCQPGTQTVSWDAEGLPAGVYYARLQEGAVASVGTMLKVR